MENKLKMEKSPIDTSFCILFEDNHFVAIDKPTGILVHKTNISEDSRFVLQLLRDQIGQRVYPVHRLDRGTSGVLIFGKTKEATGWIAAQFRAKTIAKKYLAIIRGFVEAAGMIDYPLQGKPHLPRQEAITYYKRLTLSEMNFSVGRYPTSRYSLVEITPATGRRHQIRRHFAHIRHPVIGDKKHGDCKHNKYFREVYSINRMLLHAKSLRFFHPVSEKQLYIEAGPDSEFKRAVQILKLDKPK